MADGTIERVSGQGIVASEDVDVDADGGRVTFNVYGTVTGPHYAGDDMWLADYVNPPTIRPGAEAPTVVEWDADPRAVYYDVIRVQPGPVLFYVYRPIQGSADITADYGRGTGNAPRVPSAGDCPR